MAQEPASIELYDIYGTHYIPFWQTTLFFYVVIVCCAVTLVFILYFLYRWYAERKRALPYWTTAQNALNELLASPLYSVESADLFYSRLLSILKQYLSAHFNYDFIAATDQECIQLLYTVKANNELCSMMKELFERTVTIRFARDYTLEENMRADIQKMRIVIHDMVKNAVQQEGGG